jgi:hypothetical protein
LGDCFSLASFSIIAEITKIYAVLFSSQKVLCILHNFDRKWVGPHFGRRFHNLIRSPCLAATVRGAIFDKAVRVGFFRSFSFKSASLEASKCNSEVGRHSLCGASP